MIKETSNAAKTTAAAIAPRDPIDCQTFLGGCLKGNTCGPVTALEVLSGCALLASAFIWSSIRSRTVGAGSAGLAARASAAAAAFHWSNSSRQIAHSDKCVFSACSASRSSAASECAESISLYSSWTINFVSGKCSKSRTLVLTRQKLPQLSHTGAYSSLNRSQRRFQPRGNL